jgi:hypothetical protein
MQQITVGAVQLDRIHSSAHGAAGSSHEGVPHALEIGCRHGAWNGPIGAERDR